MSSEEYRDIVYCIGTANEYASFMINYHFDVKTTKYVFLERNITILDISERKILLLNTDISTISPCILNDVAELSFYHNELLISETDTDLITKIEREYIQKHLYFLLKQLNIIKLVFDLRKKSIILSSYPLHIQLEHTTFCNARCIMCDHFIAHNRGSKHLTLNMVKSLESMFPYVSTIIMHGNGEPLLNPEILLIFDLYKEYQINTSLNTNLSYLSDEILSYLRESCKSIHVSCDGIGQEQYESIRLGLSYSTFISNIKKLSSVGDKTEMVLEVVMMRQNLRNTVNFVRFAYDYGFSKVIFNVLGCNKWIGNQKDGIQEYRSSALYLCECAKSEGVRLGISVVTPFENTPNIQQTNMDIFVPLQNTYLNLRDSEELHKRYPWYTNTIAVNELNTELLCKCNSSVDLRGVCEYPFAKTYIDLCGNVSFCCHLSRQKIDTLTAERPFKKIWNGEAYQLMRSAFYKKRLPFICSDCFQINNRSLKLLDTNSIFVGEG